MKKNSLVSTSDIELCFKALGVSYDATPAEVDKAYSGFMEKNKRGLMSADPYKVQRTRDDMNLISDLHFKIKKSVTYQDRLKHAQISHGSSGFVGNRLYLVLAAVSALIVIALILAKG